MGSKINVDRETLTEMFSLTDCYGLGLIAKYPTRDWTDVVTHLGADARQIADEIIRPGHAPRDVQKAAKELRDLADKMRNPQRG